MSSNINPIKATLTTIELVRLAAAAISDKQGVAIIAYNVGATSSITDFYLVCSGLSVPHLKALSDETRLVLKNLGINCWRTSGRPESGWIVADYIDFIVHFFKKDTRAYYDIDRLWQSAPILDLHLPPARKQDMV